MSYVEYERNESEKEDINEKMIEITEKHLDLNEEQFNMCEICVSTIQIKNQKDCCLCIEDNLCTHYDENGNPRMSESELKKLIGKKFNEIPLVIKNWYPVINSDEIVINFVDYDNSLLINYIDLIFDGINDRYTIN